MLQECLFSFSRPLNCDRKLKDKTKPWAYAALGLGSVFVYSKLTFGYHERAGHKDHKEKAGFF